jgi:hypothetical protein
MIALAGILLSLAVISLIVAPLFGRDGAPLTDGPDRVAELRELRALRDVAYETLRDIEFDHHAGKISEADYRELTERYTAEAVGLVQRIDRLTAGGPAEAPRGAR